MNIAAMALSLTMILELFHKMILFNTKLGPKLTIFLTSSSNVVNSIQEEPSNQRKFIPFKFSERLTEKAELNIYSIDAMRT
jgi:hypothetical protein